MLREVVGHVVKFVAAIDLRRKRSELVDDLAVVCILTLLVVSETVVEFLAQDFAEGGGGQLI